MSKKRTHLPQKSRTFLEKSKAFLGGGLLVCLAVFIFSACQSPSSTRLPPRPTTGVVLPLPPMSEMGMDKVPGANDRFPPEQGPVVRAALLLPFSSPNAKARHEAASMLKAAQMALFDAETDKLLLIPKDTQGSSEGTTAAVREALQEGANLFLGPLLGRNVKTVAGAAASIGVPVLAFSSDTAIAQRGVYLMGFPLDEEIRRLVDYSVEQGMETFSILRPETAYGRRAAEALREASRTKGVRVMAEKTYSEKTYVALQPIIERLAAAERPDGLFLPEKGAGLRLLASLVQDSRLGAGGTQLLGTALWHDQDILKEPALEGGIFAGQDTEAHRRFENVYRAAYGAAPSRLAGLAYDAVTLAAFFARTSENPALWIRALQDPAGFYGVDGLFRFQNNGIIERGLAVFAIRDGAFVVLDSAPKAFSDIGS